MDSINKYKNVANSDHPATILYLVDISGSMKTSMLDGKSRIDTLNDLIETSYARMIQYSLRQGKIHPRYRIGMIAYSTDIYDVYGNMGSIITIDKLKDEGVLELKPQSGTDMAKAFRYATKLLQDDISTWSQKWLDECPPPMIINITDCEFGEDAQDPTKFAKQLQKISIPDGNVLVENIFISNQIILPSTNIKDWKGYRFDESTGNVYGDKLLAMSSPLPASYAQLMSEQVGLKIREGAAMMFPGISIEFIRTGFAMSVVTGSRSQIKQYPLRPNYPEDSNDGSVQDELERETSDREAREKLAKENAQHEAKKKEAREKAESEEKSVQSTKKFKTSISYPKSLSKRYESSFLLQVYLPEDRFQVTRNIKSEFREQKTNEQLHSSSIKLGQKIKVKLSSPVFDFPESVTKLIDGTISKVTFLGMPKDSCEPGLHKVLVSISDANTDQEFESFTVIVQVVDFAFDHISRPLVSRVSTVALGIGSFAMFILTFLEQIDKTVGLTSGAAAGALALGIYASFYNLYQRVRPNTP